MEVGFGDNASQVKSSHFTERTQRQSVGNASQAIHIDQNACEQVIVNDDEDVGPQHGEDSEQPSSDRDEDEYADDEDNSS